MVWTGPTFRGTALRRTDQALLELIPEARTSIIVVTFAAYKVPLVSDALLEAAGRGVEIMLILECSDES
jgi:phosphatidylserine/phosphatidylglycerophosphate/cardiolipin synthase-like enzyme